MNRRDFDPSLKVKIYWPYSTPLQESDIVIQPKSEAEVPAYLGLKFLSKGARLVGVKTRRG